MTTGERMKQRRKELGMSAETVAEALGVSPATVYRYEKGDIEKVPGDLLDPLARVLNTTPKYLMGWEEDSEKLTTIYGDELIEKIAKNDQVCKIAKALIGLKPEEINRIEKILDALMSE